MIPAPPKSPFLQIQAVPPLESNVMFRNSRARFTHLFGFGNIHARFGYRPFQSEFIGSNMGCLHLLPCVMCFGPSPTFYLYILSGPSPLRGYLHN